MDILTLPNLLFRFFDWQHKRLGWFYLFNRLHKQPFNIAQGPLLQNRISFDILSFVL